MNIYLILHNNYIQLIISLASLSIHYAFHRVE